MRSEVFYLFGKKYNAGLGNYPMIGTIYKSAVRFFRFSIRRMM